MTSGQIEMRDDMAERVAEKKKQKKIKNKIQEENKKMVPTQMTRPLLKKILKESR